MFVTEAIPYVAFFLSGAAALDGGVVAKLAIGDLAGARRFYEELAPVLDDRSSLRARRLEAHLRAAEAGAGQRPRGARSTAKR